MLSKPVLKIDKTYSLRIKKKCPVSKYGHWRLDASLFEIYVKSINRPQPNNHVNANAHIKNDYFLYRLESKLSDTETQLEIFTCSRVENYGYP